MKKIAMFIACMFIVGMYSADAQWGAIKKVGKAAVKKTKKAGKYVGKKTKKGAKYVGKKTKKAAVYSGRKTKAGAIYTGRKTKSGAKYVGKKTKKAAVYTGRKTKAGAIYTGRKTKSGAKYVGKKTKKAAVYTGRKTKAGAIYTGRKTKSGAKYVGKKTKKAAVYTGRKTKAGAIYTGKKVASGAAFAGSATAGMVRAALYPSQFMLSKAREYSGKIGGKYGTFAFDLTTFVAQYAPEMAIALGENVKAVASGQNPAQIIAAPLSAALRAAHGSYKSVAKPLPESVKSALKDHFPAKVLDRARYTIGKVEITLPNIINRVAKYGSGHAVCVGNIIVFNTDPGDFQDNAFWWTHEIAHVEQYGNLGFEKFAYRYMKDLGKSIESDADRKATDVTQ